MKTFIVFLLGIALWGGVAAQPFTAETLPDSIYSGPQGDFHVQGMAIDKQGGFVYLSFTDKLLKLDMTGHLVGSVTGLVGHLGDLSFDGSTGKIYGSLEYKDDAIGNGIRKKLGVKGGATINFYIAMFDGSRITKVDMDAKDPALLRTVNLKTVVGDYLVEVKLKGSTVKHRFGCSGIDGVTIGPAVGPGNKDKRYLYVAYGIYGDTTRTDNDNQVILQFDYRKWWDKYGKPLTEDNPHQSGPQKPLNRYFVHTGNTTYGIQSLAYDPYTGNFFAAVYAGKKSTFPNYDLFVIDGHKKPVTRKIYTDNKVQKAQFLSLSGDGMHDHQSGVNGWHFKWGSTGLFPLGDGLFYISHNGKSKDGQQQTNLIKYKWIGAMSGMEPMSGKENGRQAFKKL